MLTLPMRIMGKVIHLLRSSSILVSNGRYYLYWTLHTPATGRRKKKMSDLLKSLLGSFTLCLVLQDDKQIASETLNKLLEVTGVENQNKSLEEETTSAQPFSFPTEDPTKWNYSILALTFVTLFLAFLILVLNSRANNTVGVHSPEDLHQFRKGVRPIVKGCLQQRLQSAINYKQKWIFDRSLLHL
ncbi:organic solute transporter subunit beta isoform X7 [Narcine bancroftii]|uniref:organic solute transporter subunit beta isoform X7 n=1 Tax=Narcine bancroftii TaxID=1343680 RepID=UPI00383176FF